MSKDVILPAHGGRGIINRIVSEGKKKHFMEKMLKSRAYTISDADLSSFYRIADGTLSPLEGPMVSRGFNNVLEKEIIERDGKKYAWTISIVFPISKKESETCGIGETIAVKSEQGVIVGGLEIEDVYYFDKIKYNRAVYGTQRCDHPGPRIINDDPREYLLGGKIWAFPFPNHPIYAYSPGYSKFIPKTKVG